MLNPADTKELYFVADGAGGHVFSETLKDHNANVQKWRRVEKDMKGQGCGARRRHADHSRASCRAAKARAVVRTVPPAKAPPADKASHDAEAPSLGEAGRMPELASVEDA